MPRHKLTANSLLIGALVLMSACNHSNPSDNPSNSSESDTSLLENQSSVGCHLPASHSSGGVQVQMDFGDLAGSERGFFLVIPDGYDSSQSHRLIMGFSGRDWTGEPMRGYLNLEDGTLGEIFVYPDPKFRTFNGWGDYRGWLLGDYAGPATGDEDFHFVRAMVDYLSQNYCIDTTQIFATGHSWGGDMSHVLACFLGDVVRAAVPVAANTPYWFVDSNGESVSCNGNTAVWTMFGVADDAFPNQPYPGAYGEEANDFWRTQNNCELESVDLGFGSPEECWAYSSCNNKTRYCLYSEQYGHEIPHNYYSEATMTFFRQFDSLQ